MKVRYHGRSSPIYFIDGQIYEVVGKQSDCWRVVDETGDDFLYDPDMFEVVEGNPDELKEIPFGE